MLCSLMVISKIHTHGVRRHWNEMLLNDSLVGCGLLWHYFCSWARGTMVFSLLGSTMNSNSQWNVNYVLRKFWKSRNSIATNKSTFTVFDKSAEINVQNVTCPDPNLFISGIALSCLIIQLYIVCYLYCL